jgi:hypothetical protein
MDTTLNGEAVVYPDIVLPAQHAARNRQLTPERRLMIAVLDDAIHCVMKYRFATDGLGRRLFEEEIQWLLSEDTRWPYSFECICEMLDLDAGAVRAGLRLTANPRSASELYALGRLELQPRDVGARQNG